MTKAVLEAGNEEEVQRTAATVPSRALAVPASLHASLMARLDRLGPAKEVAQIGAAIGREFSHALLAAVVRKPEAELGSALNCLIAAGLLFRQAAGEPPEDPLFLFSVLYGYWVVNFTAFDGDLLHKLAVQFLVQAEKQRATGPLMIGHRNAREASSLSQYQADVMVRP
jgi:hypothetical protein